MIVARKCIPALTHSGFIWYIEIVAVTVYKRQKELLEYIRQYIHEHGYSPTLVEMAKALRVSSLSTIHEHLASLTRKGVIRRLSGVVRGIELLDRKIATTLEGVELPVLGFIAAGEPIEPYTDPNATISISPFLISSKAHSYVLQVKGQSLIEEGILDGDFVVIEETSQAQDGNIVVALLDEEVVTLKRFFREKDRIRLEPANAKMSPIYTKNVRIQGKVVGVIRRYE